FTTQRGLHPELCNQKLQAWIQIALTAQVIDGALVHVHLVPGAGVPEQKPLDRSEGPILRSQPRLSGNVPERRLGSTRFAEGERRQKAARAQPAAPPTHGPRRPFTASLARA